MNSQMHSTKIYIEAAHQVSIQQPLTEAWMTEPIRYDEPFVRAVNPTFRDFIPANEVRRMGNIMKRALVTMLRLVADTGVEHPDAIITGTSLGCLDYTERFLDDLTQNGEQMLSPTWFMQSTHNTVGSALAIYTKTHGYNVTYSHGELSFDAGLLDAWMQMQLGRISTAVVGGHDEMIASYYELLKRTGYVGVKGMVPCGEVAMSMLLNTEKKADSLCGLAAVTISSFISMNQMRQQVEKMLSNAGMTYGDLSAVMTGVNGNPQNDCHYDAMVRSLFPDKPLLHYKHLFGENFTASALGVYAAAHCLHQRVLPTSLYADDTPCRQDSPESILLINQRGGKEYSLILLTAC